MIAARSPNEIRRELTAAGLDVFDWSDGQLSSLDATARIIRAGHHVFVSRAMEPLVAVLIRPKRPVAVLRTG